MAGKKEIVSEMNPIESVLLDNAITYYIPEFQRNFVWGQEETSQLLADFVEDTNNFTAETTTLEGYLLGNIVLIENNDDNGRKYVVDGQQRLTTLSLVAKALSVIVAEKLSGETDLQKIQKWSENIGDLKNGFCVRDDEGEIMSLKILHDPSLSFGSYYKKLIQDIPITDADVVKEEDANIRDVYTTIYEFLKDFDDSQLTKFIAYYKKKIKLIVTSAPTEAKAFQLFEILNDRGRSLEPMDLIKNLFLKTLNIEGKSQVQLDNFNTDWRNMMENLQLNAKKKITSSTFLKQFLLAFRGENIQTNKLFDYFKDQKNGFDGNTILTLVSQMNRVSKEYKCIEQGMYSLFKDDQNMYILFKLLGIKQFHPVLMMFYDASAEQKTKVLDSVVRLGAAVLFSYTQTNYIEKILPGVIKKYWAQKSKNPELAYNNFIEDIEQYTKECADLMVKTLPERKFVGKNGEVHSKALVILKFIELYFNHNTKIQSVPKGKKITVEHILSRNLDLSTTTVEDLGFVSDGERKDFLHQIGNLTLLYHTDNASVGNGPYKDKCPAYKGADFIITSTLVEPVITNVKNGIDTKHFAQINKYEKQYVSNNGHWTKDLIETRGKDISNLVYKIITHTIEE